jgi:hypothetical protein
MQRITLNKIQNTSKENATTQKLQVARISRQLKTIKRIEPTKI